MRKVRKFLFSKALIAESARAQQLIDTVLTLQQCLDIGIKNNLVIEQMEANRVYWQQAQITCCHHSMMMFSQF